MARMTAKDMVERVWRNVGRPQDDQLSEDDILEALNADATDIALEVEPPELIGEYTSTMTAGTNSQTVTISRCLRLMVGRNVTRGGWIREMNAQTYNRLNLASTVQQAVDPWRFVVRALGESTVTIDVFPRPMAAGVFKWVALVSPAELNVDDGTGPTISWHPNYDMLLVDRTTIRCQRWLEKYTEAAAAKSISLIDEQEARIFVKSRGRRGPGASIRSPLGRSLGTDRSGGGNG